MASSEVGNGGRRVRVRVPVRSGRHRRKGSGKRWLTWALGAAALVVVGLAVDGVWVVTQLERSLEAARTNLVRGADALRDGETASAERAFVLADDAAADLRGALRHPAGRVAGVLPLVSDDASAVRALGRASGLTARAGEHLVSAAEATGWDGREAPFVRRGERVLLEPLERAAPPLRRAASALREAEAAVDDVGTTGLVGRVRAALTQARTRLSDSARLVGKAADLADLLPDFLGGSGERRYLLALQNLSDPRGSGGFVGLAGVLRAQDGRLSLSPVVHTRDLAAPGPVEAPASVAETYRIFGSLEVLHATTYTPDFPTAARLMLRIWEASGRDRLNGVVAADPVALSYLLEATGTTVRVPAWPEPITGANVVKVLGHDTFLLPQPQSDRAQEALAREIWRAILDASPPLRGLAEGLSRAVAERHVQVFSVREREQVLLERLEASGSLPEVDNPLLVTLNGAIVNRTGYFAHRELRYEARLRPDGSAAVTLEVRVRNGAPSGPPSILLGAPGNPDDPVGTFTGWVSAYLPARARKVEVDGGLVDLSGRDGPYRMESALVQARSGKTATVRFRYELPGRPGAFSVTVLPQPALEAAEVRVRVLPPAGTRPRPVAPLAAEGRTYVYPGRPASPVRLELAW